MGFAELRRRIGFDAYYERSAAYQSSSRDSLRPTCAEEGTSVPNLEQSR